jgi:hypothetical protein
MMSQRLIEDFRKQQSKNSEKAGSKLSKSRYSEDNTQDYNFGALQSESEPSVSEFINMRLV